MTLGNWFRIERLWVAVVTPRSRHPKERKNAERKNEGPLAACMSLVALARRLLVASLRRLLGTDCLREVKPRQTDGTPRADESLY